MKVISARSPYIYNISAGTQTAGKVELFIWDKNETEPTTPTRVLIKNIPSVTQSDLYFDISPYILDKIGIVAEVNLTTASGDSTSEGNGVYYEPYQENAKNWCFVKLKSYYKTDGDWIDIEEVDYVGVKGYTKHKDELDFDKSDGDPIFIMHDTDKVLYQKPFYGQQTNGKYQLQNYFNVLIDFQKGNVYAYYQNNTTTFSYELLNDDNEEGIYMFAVPYKVSVNGLFKDSEVNVLYDGDRYNDNLQIKTLCEPKFEPITCWFINSYGGWQSIIFFKMTTNSFDVVNSEYNTIQQYPFDYRKGKKGTFNHQLKESIKVNTGWVDENYKDIISDLMVSQHIFLDNEPVTVKTKNLVVKTSIKDKTINYELDFEKNFNIINDVL